MGKITLIDDFNEKESIIYSNAEDEIERIYDVIVTLFTNKYNNMDSKKIAEERIYDSDLYRVLSEIAETLKNEPGMF